VPEKKKPTRDLKPFFWDKIDKRKLVSVLKDRDVVWKHIAPAKVKLDEKTLEKKFAKLERKKTIVSGEEASPRRKKIQVLSDKRSNALGIFLSKLPTFQVVFKAILKLDSEIIPKHLVEAIRNQLPTAEEIIGIRQVKDSGLLEKPEQFLLMLDSVSNLATRLECWSLMLTFEEKVEEVGKPLELFNQACMLLSTSPFIPKLLEVTLALGNFLNEGTTRGDAQAFEIEAIGRLLTTKSSDGTESMLAVICESLLKTFPDLALIESEFSVLFQVEKGMSLQDILSKIQQIASSFNAAQTMFVSVSRESVAVTEDLFVTKMIQFFGEAQVRLEMLQKTASAAETSFSQLTRYFLCEDKFPASESSAFFRLWSGFAKDVISCLPRVEEPKRIGRSQSAPRR